MKLAIAGTCYVDSSIAELKQSADFIAANRNTAELSEVANKAYARDLFGGDS